ncbi:MAG: UPF0149 family protein [Legionella sp.]|jgi:hypothetical protein
MSEEHPPLHLPSHDEFVESIAVLTLHISASELHGTMCGYLCAVAYDQGEAYLRALLNNKKDKASRNALVSLFSVYSVSQQQITNFDFAFEMMLPDENSSLFDRAEAFTGWCEGFVQGLNLSGVDADQFYEEDAQEALLHISEFSQLDCESLDIGEEDEKAFMEICEYTRMAVLRLHGDLVAQERDRGSFETTH